MRYVRIACVHSVLCTTYEVRIRRGILHSFLTSTGRSRLLCSFGPFLFSFLEAGLDLKTIEGHLIRVIVLSIYHR